MGGTTQFTYLNRIRDGQGDDTYDGTAGNDAYAFYDDFGNNTVVGGDGNDAIGVYTSTVGVTYTALTATSGTATSGSNSIEWSSIETFEGSDVADFANLSALTPGISYFTWGGDDTVYGGQGDNTIIRYGTTGTLTAVTYWG